MRISELNRKQFAHLETELLYDGIHVGSLYNKNGDKTVEYQSIASDLIQVNLILLISSLIESQ